MTKSNKRSSNKRPNSGEQEEASSSRERRRKRERVGDNESTASKNTSTTTTITCQKASSQLLWESASIPVPLADEEKVLELVFTGKKERGMMKSQPKSRLRSIKKLCKKLGVTILQACSLRRLYMKDKNKGMTHSQLGLGSQQHIRAAAGIFENCVQQYLSERNVSFYTEQQQKKRHPSNQPTPPTPDFLLREPVQLIVQGDPPEGVTIHFIEVKMFYGASTISGSATSNKGAVGRILGTAQKYCDLYGPGAFVFAYGCGEMLAAQLKDIGVVALDATCVNTSSLETQVRTWCSHKDGRILP